MCMLDFTVKFVQKHETPCFPTLPGTPVREHKFCSEHPTTRMSETAWHVAGAFPSSPALLVIQVVVVAASQNGSV